MCTPLSAGGGGRVGSRGWGEPLNFKRDVAGKEGGELF